MRKLIHMIILLFPLVAFGENWTFERSTTATIKFSNGSLATAPANVPRVTDGFLVEGSNIQLHGLTEEFQTWTQSGTCAVTVNDYVAPNGTLTADLLDNTGGLNTHYRYIETANLGDLTGRTFTYSVWARADIPHTATLRMYELPGVGNIGVGYIQVTNEWQRFDVTGITAGGGNNTIRIYLYPGEIVVATGAAHFWGANVTETTFSVSYIPNAGAAASQVTRTPDSITFDPHPAGETDWSLPMEYSPNPPNDKLTVYLEARCQFADNTELDVNRMFISISGNTGAGARQADHAHNRLSILTQETGAIQAFMSTSDGTTHMATTAANPVVYSEWFSMRAFFDFSDFSRMNFWMQQCAGSCSAENEVATVSFFTNNIGTGTFYTDDTMIRLGQWYYDVVNAHCHLRNVRINNKEITP